MKKQQTFFKWLALAALAEWLLARTFTRAAIHVPKSPGMISLYTAVNQVGQVAAAFVALLALVLLLWIAWHSRRHVWLPLALSVLVVLSLLFLLIVPPPWLVVLYQLLAVTAVFLICVSSEWAKAPGLGRKRRWRGAALLLFPAGALLAGLFYQLLPNLYAMLNWPGPPPLTGALFNLGQSLVIGSVVVWWVGFGRSSSWSLWAGAAVPALLFALSFWRDPAMTGILAIWSTGLTLFLPWPLYTLALWLVGLTVLAAWRAHPLLVYAILLLVSAGYAPQLSSQLFCAIIALWLLARPFPHTHAQTALSSSTSNTRITVPIPATDNR